jgi:hypothetical protein
MKHSAGLDVSVKETAICIVDEVGKVVRETKVVTEPESIIALLNSAGVEYERVGLEQDRCRNVVNGLAEGRAAGDLRGDTPHEGRAEGPAG